MKETFSGIEKQKLNNAHVSLMNAENLGFQEGSFDFVLGGFVGWDYCYDFILNKFIGPDTRMEEIFRVLREGGRVAVCAWERQNDLEWLEEKLIRQFPSLVSDREKGAGSDPLVYSRENPEGYGAILQNAGFKTIEFNKEKVELCSTDEEEWWEQMRHLGWQLYFDRLEKMGSNTLQTFKKSVFKDLEHYKHPDGIHFTKSVFYAYGEK